jgi:hypothetical protein
MTDFQFGLPRKATAAKQSTLGTGYPSASRKGLCQMFGKDWKTILAGIVGASLASAALAATAQSTNSQLSRPVYRPRPAHTAMTQKVKLETVTFDIHGASDMKSAQTLDSALASRHLNAKVESSPDKPYRLTAKIRPNMDLGAVGQAVRDANTLEKTKNPPSLDLVLFGKLDQSASEKAMGVLAKIKGVDVKDSKIDTSAGEIQVRISGGAKLTADQIHRALLDAGVWTEYTRSNASRTS